MKHAFLIALMVVLAASVAIAGETTVDWDYYTIDTTTTYIYMLTSGEASDVITSFHVYAPVDYSLLRNWTAGDGWAFEATRDEETGGTDMHWYLPVGVASGLAEDDQLMVSIDTPWTVPTNEEYQLPGCFGNWGVEVAGWPGSVTVMSPAVGVPQSFESVPEPGAIVTLLGGCGMLAGKLRKRR